MKTLLETDLSALVNSRIAWRDGRPYIEGSSVKAYYWIRVLTSSGRSQIVYEMNEKETLLFVAIARRVIALGLEARDLSGDQVACIIETIEMAHVARFERKLMHIKASPQLLIEAEAELRDKKALTKEAE